MAELSSSIHLHMLSIHYPEPDFRIKSEGGQQYIFDALRKKWILLTPEEWVRQNFIQYLVRVMNYPAALIAVEKEIWLGEMKKRFDILIYNNEHQPWMLIECKSADITLTEDTLQQVLRYNMTVPVPYIIITNGNSNHGWKKEPNELRLINELPAHGS
jgi:hypothetical protein